jgi:hypothetical protein
MLPDLALPGGDPRVALRSIAGGPLDRAILSVTRATDASRPSTRAVLDAVREAAAALPAVG